MSKGVDKAKKKIDAQIVELIGRNRLGTELLRAGLEVALPARDRGIDMIAYADLTSDTKSFTAKPIQMKAASTWSFSINRKYERIRGLIIAFVWHLEDPEKAVTYALTWEEAFEVAQAMGYTKTLKSWMRDGSYSTTRPSERLRRLLMPFKMTSDKWRIRVLGDAI